MSATDEPHLAAAPLPLPASAQDTAPAGPPPAGRGVLASDDEREAAVARLHYGLGEGRLDLAETDARVAAAYAARYRGDLPSLLADLPDSGPAESDTPTWTAVWTSLVWRTRLTRLGPASSAEAPPTPAQCRTAAVLVVSAAVWVTICAVLGAVLVR